MLKYWRILLLFIVITGAVLAIGLKPRVHGVEVAYVTRDSPASGILKQGMVISELNGHAVSSAQQWDSEAMSLRGPVSLVADGVAYDFTVNDSIGIETEDLQSTNLEFGLDLRGGTRIILKPRENATRATIEQVIGTLQTRINMYGLKEIKFFPVESPDGWYIQIEATGVGRDVVDELLSSKGSFEAKVSKPVDIRNGRGTMQLGQNTYPVEVTNETVRVNGQDIPANGSFQLEGIDFQLGNTSAGKVIFMATVYRGNDIENIYTDPQHSSLVPYGNYYKFYFTVLVSSQGAERFAKVTSGVPSQMDLNSGEYYLKDCEIFLYLDNELQSNLRIASSLGGKAYSTPQIEGSRETRDDAAQEKMKLQTILRSGALPVSLETSSIAIISPTLGSNFIQAAMLAALVAGAVVITIVFVRYRKFKVAVPLVLIGLSEIIIVLGISASGPYDTAIWMSVLVANLLVIILAWWKLHESDLSAWAGAMLVPILGLLSWNTDLPAIGGLIAAIGTGVDQMIIIADETVGGKNITRKIYSIKEKIGRAFFIVFTAAATNISSLLPMLFVAAGIFMRGFVITTIVGILTGILITRPAYAKLIEAGTEHEHSKKQDNKQPQS